jgi:mono/diheme cytochrome c family protein
MDKRVFFRVWLGLSVTALAAAVRADDQIDFARDIRPILSDACSQCHGPDATQRKADLRLDTRQGLFGNRDGGVREQADHTLCVPPLVRSPFDRE